MSSQFKPSTGYKEKAIENFNRKGVMKTLNASMYCLSITA